MGAPRAVAKTNPIIAICSNLSQSSSMHQTLTWLSHRSPYKSASPTSSPISSPSTLPQTSQTLTFWCSSPRLTSKSKFLVNCEPTMSPKSPNVGVVDFGEEEVRTQPRDTGKRKFLVFLPRPIEGFTHQPPTPLFRPTKKSTLLIINYTITN
jgi:hypothetical protein